MPAILAAKPGPSEELFHVMLIHKGVSDDPAADVRNIRVCDTFDSLPAAKDAAHRCLFDAGYEREWFTTYAVKESNDEDWKYGDEVVAYAAARNDEIFLVKICTTTNTNALKGNDQGLVDVDLYYLIVTECDYTKDAAGRAWDSRVFGAYTSSVKAHKASKTALEDDNGHREWAEYDELQDDSELGENVVIHAVGLYGQNYTVHVVKKLELEAVRIAAAAKKLRA